MSLYDAFIRFDDELHARAHQPPLSAWWREEARRFLDAYETGEALEHWICCGRGGSKSTYAYKLALFLCIYGEFTVPASEMHFAMVLSKNKTEAAKGVAIISRWLAALGIEHEPKQELVEFPTLRRGIRVVSASVSATSGWRCFLVVCDEFSKWARENEAQLLDADEVLLSARATTVTHPRAICVVASTPWGDEGSFYQAITQGTTDERVVSGPAASWIANPGAITEAHTKKLAKGSKWRREYASEFVGSFEDGYFPTELVKRAMIGGTDSKPDPNGSYAITIDPAFLGDSFATVVAHHECVEDGRTCIVIDRVWASAPPKGGTLSVQRCINEVRQTRREWRGSNIVYSDQHAAAPLAALFSQVGVVLVCEPWTNETKRYGYALALQLLSDGRLVLPYDRALEREMLSIGVRLTTAGNEVIASRGSHDDRISAVIHAVVKASRLPALNSHYRGQTLRQQLGVGPRPFGNVGGTQGGMLDDVRSIPRHTGDEMYDAYADSVARDRRR